MNTHKRFVCVDYKDSKSSIVFRMKVCSSLETIECNITIMENWLYCRWDLLSNLVPGKYLSFALPGYTKIRSFYVLKYMQTKFQFIRKAASPVVHF